MTTKLAKHTPGPLYVRIRDGMTHAVATKDHATTRRTTDDDIAWFNRPEDAILFKAAPAMLEALKLLREALRGSAGDAICKCNAVGESATDCPIAKAEDAIRAAVGAQEENTQ